MAKRKNVNALEKYLLALEPLTDRYGALLLRAATDAVVEIAKQELIAGALPPDDFAQLCRDCNKFVSIAEELSRKSSSSPPAPPAEPELRTTLGERVRHLRLSKGLSQRQLSEGAGVGLHTVNRIENCVHQPNDMVVSALARFFGCGTGWLLHGKGSAQEPSRRSEEW